MPNGYWIVHVDVTDIEQFNAYVAANVAPLKRYGAKFPMRGGRFEPVEGKSRSRNTVNVHKYTNR